MNGTQMKAIVLTKYGSFDVLQLKEVEKPTPGGNEALVKIHATSLNAADMEIMRGDFMPRLLYKGLFKPKYTILGTDLAGTIESVGKNVKEFKPGDEIWGDLSFPYKHGAFAEYVCIPEKALRLKPASMTFEEAAATPTSAVVALQHLRCKRPLEKGHKVLLNGAGGSVGTFAIQIAKHFGAEVTAVDSTKKLDMLSEIGADHVIDYTKEDFTKNGKHYDLIVDVVVQRWAFAYKRALSPNGIAVLVGGSMKKVFLNVLLGLFIKVTTGKKIGLGMWKPNKKEDLDFLQELFETGKVKPVIDKTYPLSKIPEAMKRLEKGGVMGKAVVRVVDEKKS